MLLTYSSIASATFFENFTASRHEVEYAKIDGVKFLFYTSPTEIIDEGIRYVKTKVETDEKGHDKIVTIEGSEGLFSCDSIIIAVSQGPRANIVSNTTGINVTNQGLVATDEFGHTTREGVFASGDVVTGAKTVVEAVKFSKKVADAIDEFVNSKY